MLLTAEPSLHSHEKQTSPGKIDGLQNSGLLKETRYDTTQPYFPKSGSEAGGLHSRRA